jgi:hypothetical protein
MPFKTKTTATVTAVLVTGGVNEIIGTITGNAIEVMFSDCAGNEHVRVEFYHGKTIVLSQGIHGIKILSRPASGECGLHLVHSSGTKVFIKAESPPNVRLVASIQSGSPTRFGHRAKISRGGKSVARLGLLALLLAVVFALTACSSFGAPQLPYVVPGPTPHIGTENVRFYVQHSEDYEQPLERIALEFNAELRVLAAAHRLALTRDEQGLTQLATLGSVSANYVEVAIRAVVSAIQALIEMVRAKQRREALLELIGKQWVQAVAELKGKLHSLFEELKLVRSQREIEKHNLSVAQAELEAIDTLVREGLFRGQPARERAAAWENVKEAQRRVYALQKEEQRLENATMDLVGGYAAD